MRKKPLEFEEGDFIFLRVYKCWIFLWKR